MHKKITILVYFISVIFVFANVARAYVPVRGYVKSNGTYVRPHYRSEPDGYFWNNWSTYGNVNPFTGKVGTKKISRNTVPSYSCLSDYSGMVYEMKPCNYSWKNVSTCLNIDPYSNAFDSILKTLDSIYTELIKKYYYKQITLPK